MIFDQIDIDIIKDDDTDLLSNIHDGLFIIATNSKSKMIKLNDEYIGLDYNSVYISNYIQNIEVNDDVLVIIIKGELCDKYIEEKVINCVLKFSAHNKIIRIINSILNGELDIYQIKQKKKFSLATEILIDIVFYKQSNIDKTNRVVNDALYYIHEYYYEIYGVEQLADRLNVSESYLIRMFKKHMDITPLKYLQQIKIEKAKELLLQKSLDLKTVAGLCGYSDANYLGKVFKKFCGVTPGEYRKLKQDDMHDSLPDEYYL